MNNFRPINRDMDFPLPPSVDEWLPQRHLARFATEVVDWLDLQAITDLPVQLKCNPTQVGQRIPFHGGLDWGEPAYAVCVIDGTGQIVARIEARHDATGLAGMLAQLRKIVPPDELPIAIERPCRLVVDPLIGVGHRVVLTQAWSG